MQHVILLGDSVFDNAAYVGDGPDVIGQLSAALPAGWRAELHAMDGAQIADIEAQLGAASNRATHLVVSIGGNDALRESGVLGQNARSVAEALEKLAAIRERFQQAYASMLDLVVARRLPTAVCTIYEPRFPETSRRRLSATALAMLNDCITREAFYRTLALVDLRLICDCEEDFANAIEPFVRGGAKIADAVVRFATGATGEAIIFARRRSSQVEPKRDDPSDG